MTKSLLDKKSGENIRKSDITNIDPQEVVEKYQQSKEQAIKVMLEEPEKHENKDPNLKLIITENFRAAIYQREFTKQPGTPKVSYVYTLIGGKLYKGRMKNPFISFPTLNIAEEKPENRIVDVKAIIAEGGKYKAKVVNEEGKSLLIPLKEVIFSNAVVKKE